MSCITTEQPITTYEEIKARKLNENLWEYIGEQLSYIFI